MEQHRVPVLITTVLVGMLVGTGLGMAVVGGELARLRMDNHELRHDNEALRAAGLYEPAGHGVEPADLPRTLSRAEAEGYVLTHWGRCVADVGSHYTKTEPGYDGPHLLFDRDGKLLGYKLIQRADGSRTVPDPWTYSQGHPGLQAPHWDLYVFVRDPTGACRG